jgi:hypothetical protein
MKVCPNCGTTTLSARKTLLDFKCTKCKKVSKEPKVISKEVTAFRAFYAPQWKQFEPPILRESINIPFKNKAVQNAIRPLDLERLIKLIGIPSEAEEVEKELSAFLGKPKQGGGFAPGLNAAQKKAIEACAMHVSREALEGDDWVVDDVSTNHPFDLLARKGDAEMHVEVKGTTTLGEQVVLTRGEVKHHHTTTTTSALHLVTGITLSGPKDSPEATGGVLRVICPWKIDPAALDPLAFEYTVPPAPPAKK